MAHMDHMSMTSMTTPNHMTGHVMNHSGMDHSGMDHSGMDHSGMDHSGMDHSGMNMGNSTGCNGMGMMMYFHTGNCEYVLFKSLYTTTPGEMVGACIVVFILAALYEGFKVAREELLKRALSNKYTVQNGSVSQDTIIGDGKNTGLYMLSMPHFVQTVLHVVQVFLSYCLMLIFMTYNAWLCLAVVLGAGVGYFLFSWRRAVVVDLNEHCH